MRIFIGTACIALLASQMARADDPKPAGRAIAGEYVEIDPEGRPNPMFLLVVQEVTPNIVQLRGKNGWVAFASFDAEKKEYRGSFEWQTLPGGQPPGGKWGDLYQVQIVVADGVLRIEGKSAANEMLIRARPVGDVAAGKP